MDEEIKFMLTMEKCGLNTINHLPWIIFMVEQNFHKVNPPYIYIKKLVDDFVYAYSECSKASFIENLKEFINKDAYKFISTIRDNKLTLGEIMEAYAKIQMNN